MEGQEEDKKVVKGQREEEEHKKEEEKEGGAGPGIRNLLNAHKSLQIMERGSGQRLWECMGTMKVRGGIKPWIC